MVDADVPDETLPPEEKDSVSTQSADRILESETTTSYSYIYASGKLLQEKVTTNGTTETHNFFYDNTGKPYAMQINGTTYYYVTNLQGDVMGLVDTSGNTVASYTYDPYGKPLTATGELAEKNPLRYRGYYYDSESGLYYLQSRYYDPTTRRFVNADAYASTGQGIIGSNAYAYCNNNPILLVDHEGTIGVLGSMLIGGLIGVGSQFVSGVVNNILEGKKGSDIFQDTGTVGDYVAAFASGALCAIPGAGTVVSVICDIASPAVQQGVDYLITGDSWNTRDYLADVGCNLLCDVATSALTVDVPEHIRDIKAEAQAQGLKGTTQYMAYLKSAKVQSNVCNGIVEVMGGAAMTVYRKVYSKAKMLLWEG